MTNPNTKQLRQIHIDVAADFGITSLQLQAANDHWKGEPALATALHECKALQEGPWSKMHYSKMATESEWLAACLSLATETYPNYRQKKALARAAAREAAALAAAEGAPATPDAGDGLGL